MKCLNTLLLTAAISTQASAAGIDFVFKFDSDATTSPKASMVMIATNEGYTRHEAYSGRLPPGKDHRDRITNWWTESSSSLYGTYKIQIWCEHMIGSKPEALELERIINIPKSNKLQTVTVRATCILDQNDKPFPPKNIQVIGPISS
jgi:hypothetical protein